ncbi:MAG: tRNA (N(6)-L-threonylcarbamoyladenosine(37)-C(2))-methylthiotransferase MtaB [Defluviitaleaceae bacterium]|nr:tRNA (N(6)-L-threonylcarbamoyladenosine(37)-C(2))-methylthiotransferase MtaB [Defluviitaleaceae bacterium]
MKTLATYTLGCKVNTYDTEAIVKLFIDRGYETSDFDSFSDIYIINTCTVTNLSDKKSRQALRRCKKINPNGIVVVMGCYAQVAADEIKEIEDVDIVIGTKDRKNIVDIVEGYKPGISALNYVTDIQNDEAFEYFSVSSFEGKTRAFLKVQDGCDRFCTYCIIPYARGNVRSRQPDDAVNEARQLEKNGFKEIVLAGIHVASYGKDLTNIDLLELIKYIHDVDGIERIRLSSIDPVVVDSKFVNALANLPKVCDHFHMSLQSGCNKTLNAMGRRYSREQYLQSVLLLRDAFENAALTTDIISGFPGETEDDFLESYEFLEHIGFSKIHGFPYSPRKGTKAANYDNQVPKAIKEERNRKISILSDRLSIQFREKFIGKEMDVLYEALSLSDETDAKLNCDFKEIDGKSYVGYTTNYIKVSTKSCENLINVIKPTVL